MKLLPLIVLNCIFVNAMSSFSVIHVRGVQQTDTLNAIYENGTVPQLVSNQFSFTEGPATDKNGNVFFTDQPNNKIWKYSTDGKLSLFLNQAGRSNGMYFDNKGNLISCADEHGQLWSVTPDKKITVLVDNFGGKQLNGPNDVWVNRLNGDMYFTDPYFHRPYWTRTKPELQQENIYLLSKGNKEAVVADDHFVKPNGIVGTPDGKYLYVADAGANKTYKFSIAANGSLYNRQLFVNQGSDGMTLDDRGNVYLTGKGVTVYSPEGVKIAHIDIPQPWTANICFFGKKRDMLFITASTAVYTIKTKVKGVE